MTSRTAPAVILLLTLVLFPPLCFAQTAFHDTDIKKIVMMLNIIVSEYRKAVVDEKVVNEIEYEEGQALLQQTSELAASIMQSSKNPDTADEVRNEFAAFARLVKERKNSDEIKKIVAGIQSKFIKEFDLKMNTAPQQAVSLGDGRVIFEANCKICHGSNGKGDGPVANQLNPHPANLSDPALTGNESTAPYDNFQVISVGVAGTAMVGWADILSEKDIWNVTYYIRTFSNDNLKLPEVNANATGGSTIKITEKVFSDTRSQLEQSLRSYKEQKFKEAVQQAFDSYLTFEKLETALLSKDKDFGLKLESTFGSLSTLMKKQVPLNEIEKTYNVIWAGLSRAEEILTAKVGYAGLFLQSITIIVREGFEAILIIAALVTFLIKSGNSNKLRAIYSGITIGILGSFVTAYILHEILQITAANQEVIEGWIMLVAVVVLFWVSYWLISKIDTQKWQSYITSQIQEAVTTGSAFALATVAFLSVYREGFETVLFYKALYSYAGSETGGIFSGFLAGCACLGVIYYLINKVGIRVPVRWFFAVTSVFLYYMAFTFMGKGLHELQLGGKIPMTLAGFLPQIGFFGIYPTWETFAGQGVLVALYVFALFYSFGFKPEIETQTTKAETHHIQADLTAVHDLVEHISNHVKQCEAKLREINAVDGQEIPEHLKEIDVKVHELADHVRTLENRLMDDYERLNQMLQNTRRKS